MVKAFVFFCIVSMSTLVIAQTDTLKCEEYFAYFDTLLGKNLIFIWEVPPTLKECSQKSISKLRKFIRENTNYKFVLVDMIIDSKGVPICFRFRQKIKTEIKTKLINNLKSLRFTPALNDRKVVKSIYTLKI